MGKQKFTVWLIVLLFILGLSPLRIGYAARTDCSESIDWASIIKASENPDLLTNIHNAQDRKAISDILKRLIANGEEGKKNTAKGDVLGQEYERVYSAFINELDKANALDKYIKEKSADISPEELEGAKTTLKEKLAELTIQGEIIKSQRLELDIVTNTYKKLINDLDDILKSYHFIIKEIVRHQDGPPEMKEILYKFFKDSEFANDGQFTSTLNRNYVCYN